MTFDGREWSVSGVLISSVRVHSKKNKSKSAVNRSLLPELVTLVGLSVRQLGHIIVLVLTCVRCQCKVKKICKKYEEEEA